MGTGIAPATPAPPQPSPEKRDRMFQNVLEIPNGMGLGTGITPATPAAPQQNPEEHSRMFSLGMGTGIAPATRTPPPQSPGMFQNVLVGNGDGNRESTGHTRCTTAEPWKVPECSRFPMEQEQVWPHLLHHHRALRNVPECSRTFPAGMGSGMGIGTKPCRVLERSRVFPMRMGIGIGEFGSPGGADPYTAGDPTAQRPQNCTDPIKPPETP